VELRDVKEDVVAALLDGSATGCPHVVVISRILVAQNLARGLQEHWRPEEAGSARVRAGVEGEILNSVECGYRVRGLGHGLRDKGEPEDSGGNEARAHVVEPPNGSRVSCCALKKDSFINLRAPSASGAC